MKALMTKGEKKDAKSAETQKPKDDLEQAVDTIRQSLNSGPYNKNVLELTEVVADPPANQASPEGDGTALKDNELLVDQAVLSSSQNALSDLLRYASQGASRPQANFSEDGSMSNERRKPASELESIVIGMLQPQMQQWLSEHLPDIVKKEAKAHVRDWLNGNLEEIVSTMVEREIKKLVPKHEK